MEPDLDVVGVGNALVDVLVETGTDVLESSGLAKGTMTLMDPAESERIHARVGAGVERSGGSAANTIAGLAALGAQVGYIGRVADDRLGAVFTDDIAALKVVSGLSRSARGATGRCLILVTPDADRTLCTSLGASAELEPADIDHALVSRAAYLYLEGYLFDPPAAKSAFRDAIATAHRAGRRVALSLSDPFCVERHREDFAALVADEVDVLFGNEAEACLLTGADDADEAGRRLRRPGLTATITLGPAGALVFDGAGDVMRVPAAEPERVVDTTGAGDLYAAGFLRGLTWGLSLERCALLGAIAAAEVIAHIGARPEADLAALVASVRG